MKITEKEVRYVADLANLALNDSEVAAMVRDMDEILTHIEKLNALDTSNVEPMAQVLYDAPPDATLREDREHQPLSNPEALANAPLKAGGYYKVPKVIER
ncbi:MAG: Asp-tRNA(Asn)/Glu-tRNA(Gln) amidotransferase subunit GatC [Bryobacteraceae bacterium]|nr:Asp-tRNA(Asn)/Glu-tRNA(Gln) amidotransferase subunit GatC [Bryobacteraceae bacterium]